MDSFIRYNDHSGAQHLASLPEIIANLSTDSVSSFPALRAHQRQPWHCFLVQLATMALQRAERDTIPTNPAEWAELLRALTPEFPGDEPWKLVVEDWSKPALLQPPGMSTAVGAKSKKALTPDGIDMLLTGRNHDLKGSRMVRAQTDDWLFALVTLQTSEGQNGAGKYGISRMNGGYGSRVFVGIRSTPLTPGRALIRDVQVLLKQRSGLNAKQALGLIWLEPWDGNSQLCVGNLDPLYIEVCRRVRICDIGDGEMQVVIESSKAARINAKMLKGVTDDPWAPILSDRTASWGIGASGFGYRQMTKLLSPKLIDQALLSTPHKEDGTKGVVLHACGLTRGQGKTEGFHERTIPVPVKAVAFMSSRSGRDRISEVAEARMNAAGEAQKIVRHALMSLYQGGPEQPKLDDDTSSARIAMPMSSFDHKIDECFFDDSFWTEVSIEKITSTQSEDLARQWRVCLHQLARTTLQVASQAMPRSSTKQWQAMARSKSLLERRMRRFVDPDLELQKNTKEASI